LNLENAQRVAAEIGGVACQCDVSNPESMQAAIDAAAAAHGPARILMQIAGIGSAKRVVGKDGNAAPLEDFARVINVNGGAIALGHPLAATGVRLTLTLARELQRSGKKYGISSACVGGGQGIALLIENLEGN
ncbi:MAG: SDR family oxidoreductase, partial [Hydrogenophaga sp.]|uniref:SDR family oxidoreductase n=1 Tax=Hydrogenophaga sp. TaxID=1904254 RepID=UPI002ABAC2C8